MSLDLSSGPLQFDPYRRGRFRPGPVAKWGLFILSLVLMGFLFGTTSLQGIKNWLARGEAAAAMQAIQEERWGYAIMCLQKARSYAPEEPEVLLAAIEFLKVTENDPVSLCQQLRMLADKQPLTADQQILLASSLLKAGSPEKARETIERLPQEARQEEQFTQLAAAILNAEGRGDEARQLQWQDRKKSPDTPESLLETALTQRRSSLEKERRASRDILWHLTRDQTAIGLQAITHLAMDEGITWQETSKLLALEANHANRSLPIRLGIVTARMRLRPDLREKLISDEVARFLQNNGGKLDEIARWLAFEKQHARLLQLIPPPLRASSRELFPIVAQALAEEGRWQELKDLLTGSRTPVKKARVELWLAEAESHLTPGQDTNARRHLKSSIETARLEKDLSTLVAAVPAAERLSHPDLAMLACDALLEHRTGNAQMEILQKAAGLATLLRDTRAMLAYARQLHELRPTSPVFAERLAYLRLILGEEIEIVDLPMLQKLGSFEGIKLEVNRIPAELLQGLIAYRLGDREAMRRHLSDSPVSPALPPGYRAVFSGLLATSGKPAQAYQIAEKIPDALLLDEELQFLNLAR